MKAKQVQDIVARHALPGSPEDTTLIETHISWVILTHEFAFKIKKPLKLHFLNFSTLALRHYYCLEELRLNRRLAPAMYLDVLPIGPENGLLTIGAGTPPIADYCVQMRRMDNSRQMDLLLGQGAVSPTDMQHLAALLARFHRKHRLQESVHIDMDSEIKDFADLFTLKDTLLAMLGGETEPVLTAMERQVRDFLEGHLLRLRARAASGFWVDGHGDLHTRNIMLCPDPVVFDCIEFNPHLRRLDVLNELAFLCMDLECRKRPDLATVFMEAYQTHWAVVNEQEDALLFRYFKLYRANVRLKVTALQWQQHGSESLRETGLNYWKYMAGFADTQDGVFF
jgi:hypothetical protein